MRDHFRQGAGAVAEVVFFRGVQLRESFSGGQEKDRIVAEPVFPSGREGDGPFQAPLLQDHGAPASGRRQGGHGPEYGRSAARSGVAQLLQKLPVIGRVVAAGAGVAGGVNPRGASERGHLQAGVLREGPQPGRGGRFQGLFLGVAFQGGPVFHDGSQAGKVVEPDPLNRKLP